jgi:hypothetical protein
LLDEDFFAEVKVPDEVIIFRVRSRKKIPPDIVAEKLSPEGLPVIIPDTNGIRVVISGFGLIGRGKMHIGKPGEEREVIERNSFRFEFAALTSSFPFIDNQVIKRGWSGSHKNINESLVSLVAKKGCFYPEILESRGFHPCLVRPDLFRVEG